MARDDVVAAFGHLTRFLDHPMLIVTARAGDRVDGCLVGFHAQCSIDPLRYVVMLSEANRTTQLAQRSTTLGLHFVARDQVALAEHFGATTGHETDKLAGFEWSDGPDGVPVLDACANHFVGRVIDRVSVGDHIAHMLDLIDGEVEEHPELLRLGQVIDLDPGREP